MCCMWGGRMRNKNSYSVAPCIGQKYITMGLSCTTPTHPEWAFPVNAASVGLDESHGSTAIWALWSHAAIAVLDPGTRRCPPCWGSLLSLDTQTTVKALFDGAQLTLGHLRMLL